MLQLRGVEIRAGFGDGMRLEPASGPVAGCTIARCRGFPLAGTLQRVRDHVGNKATDEILLDIPPRLGSPTVLEMTKPHSLSGSGVFGCATKSVFFPAGATVTFDAGTIQELPSGSVLVVKNAKRTVAVGVTTLEDGAQGGRYWKNKLPRRPLRGHFLEVHEIDIRSPRGSSRTKLPASPNAPGAAPPPRRVRSTHGTGEGAGRGCHGRVALRLRSATTTAAAARDPGRHGACACPARPVVHLIGEWR